VGQGVLVYDWILVLLSETMLICSHFYAVRGRCLKMNLIIQLIKQVNDDSVIWCF
jgi:hypothetical protein